MKRLIKVSLSLVLALALLLPASFVVLAEEITCRGSMGPRTVDNLRVPQNASSVTVTNSVVGGSIQIKQGGAARIYKVRIKGDILFDSNKRALSATYNKVGGNLQAFQNRGGVTISYNTIDGNLQCKANRPAPTGRKNVVHGNKEDQCARL
jgi:hypothetical protein